MLWENVTGKLLNIQGVDVNFKDKNQCQPLSLVGKNNTASYGNNDERFANIYHLLLERTNDIPW